MADREDRKPAALESDLGRDSESAGVRKLGVSVLVLAVVRGVVRAGGQAVFQAVVQVPELVDPAAWVVSPALASVTELAEPVAQERAVDQERAQAQAPVSAENLELERRLAQERTVACVEDSELVQQAAEPVVVLAEELELARALARVARDTEAASAVELELRSAQGPYRPVWEPELAACSAAAMCPAHRSRIKLPFRNSKKPICKICCGF